MITRKNRYLIPRVKLSQSCQVYKETELRLPGVADTPIELSNSPTELSSNMPSVRGPSASSLASRGSSDRVSRFRKVREAAPPISQAPIPSYFPPSKSRNQAAKHAEAKAVLVRHPPGELPEVPLLPPWAVNQGAGFVLSLPRP